MKESRAQHGTGDLLSAAVVMVVYFTYMLMIAFAPHVFAKPVAGGSTVSVGLVSGIVMALFMIAFCAWYTHRRNSREGDGESFDTRH